jgi:hypothetical protein
MLVRWDTTHSSLLLASPHSSLLLAAARFPQLIKLMKLTRLIRLFRVLRLSRILARLGEYYTNSENCGVIFCLAENALEIKNSVSAIAKFLTLTIIAGKTLAHCGFVLHNVILQQHIGMRARFIWLPASKAWAPRRG